MDWAMRCSKSSPTLGELTLPLTNIKCDINLIKSIHHERLIGHNYRANDTITKHIQLQFQAVSRKEKRSNQNEMT